MSSDHINVIYLKELLRRTKELTASAKSLEDAVFAVAETLAVDTDEPEKPENIRAVKDRYGNERQYVMSKNDIEGDDDIIVFIDKDVYRIPMVDFVADEEKRVTGEYILRLKYGDDWHEYKLNAKTSDGSGRRTRVGHNYYIPRSELLDVERFETIRKYSVAG